MKYINLQCMYYVHLFYKHQWNTKWAFVCIFTLENNVIFTREEITIVVVT